MDLTEFARLLSFDDPYKPCYATNTQKEIRAKPTLTGERLVALLLYLASHTNKEGYDHALFDVFGDDWVAYRSSLSKAREKVSWRYFREAFERLVDAVDCRRTTFGGLTIFAIDGHQLVLPATADIYENGYSGFPLEDERETHTLRAYMSHCYDVLTEISSGVTFSSTLDEHRDRRKLLGGVPDGSLVIYDRLYFSEDLVTSHAERRKVYFLARCKLAATNEVDAFVQDGSKDKSSTTRYGKRIYFFKVFHPKTGELSVYATDLPESWHRPELLGRLYASRWGVEGEQRDVTETIKLEQWHSTTLNGVLQEFYARLWLVNIVRVAMLLSGAQSVSPTDTVYKKPNFKLCFNFFATRMRDWFASPAALIVKLSRIIKRTLERRERYRRNYPRVTKGQASPYARASVVSSRARPPPKR